METHPIAASSEMERRAARRRGFTLVEALLSMLLFGLGSAAVYGLLQGMVRVNDLASRATTATTIAQDKVESLTRHGSPPLGLGYDVVDTFRRFWIVVPGASADSREALVIVLWSGLDGQYHWSNLRHYVTP